MSCRLCYTDTGTLLPVFTEAGADFMGMAHSIYKFLEIEVNADDATNEICPSCWANVDNFQKFYNMISEKQMQNNAVLSNVIKEELCENSVDFVDLKIDTEDFYSNETKDTLVSEEEETLDSEEEETLDSEEEEIFDSEREETMDWSGTNQSYENESALEEEEQEVEQEDFSITIPSAKFKWKPAEQLQLIEEYHKRPELWNVKNKEFYNKKLKDESLQDIAKIIGCTAGDVIRKMGLLSVRYHAEAEKSKNTKYKPNWDLYERLAFLKEHSADINSLYKSKICNNVSDNQQTAYDWTEEEIFKLIDECKKWHVLWVKNHPDFRNRFLKYEVLDEVGKIVGCSRIEAWEKFSHMRAFFYTEVKTMTNKPSYHSKWKYFKRLLYLRKNLNDNEQLIINKWVRDNAVNDKGFIWTKATIAQLISLYESHPEIWNRQHSGYNNTNIRSNSLHLIAITIGCTPNDAQRKFNTLRTYFKTEMKRTNGSTWRFFNDLMFLKNDLMFLT